MERQHDETSVALLDAAHRLLAEVGPDALTVRRIANEAGMSTMNVYSRFGGKDGVIDELYRDGYERLIAAIAAVESTDDTASDMLQIAHAYRDFAGANPTYYGIMFRSTVPGFTPSARSVELAMTGLAQFVDRVHDGQQRGHIVDVAAFEPTAIAAWLWATCHGLVSLELDRVAEDHVTWPSIFENGMRTAIHGLHPSVAPVPADDG